MKETFLARSQAANEVLKTANLIKNLRINAIITGESGTGKSLLARMVMPEAPVVDAAAGDDVEEMLRRNDELIIENFNRVPNFDRLEMGDKKIVATCATRMDDAVIDRFFGIKMEIPPLSQRPEDVAPIAEHFLEEARATLMVDRKVEVSKLPLDLSRNCHSLKKSVYFSLLMDNIEEGDLMRLMEKYLMDRLEGNNAYRENLHLFDRPIIEAGLKKYGSQLKLSEVLGINRNTLRKKVYELGVDTDVKKG